MHSLLNKDAIYDITRTGEGARYASKLLHDLGAKVLHTASAKDTPQTCRWRESGLRALTGFSDQPPVDCPVPIADYGDAVLEAFRLLANDGFNSTLRGADVMAMRATMANLTRNGDCSPGGSCRILNTADKPIALNLAREDDWQLLSAWLEVQLEPNWKAVATQVSHRPSNILIERARLVGLAATEADVETPDDARWFTVLHRALPTSSRQRAPRVIDLSSLWAGPLCSQLLRWTGSDVVKVESRHRADGARQGSAKFFQWLNEGKSPQTLDLSQPAGIEALRDLILGADIVVESSRPRALRQMGLHAETLMDAAPGLTWVSITGYGRADPWDNWIAYGDDAAVAAGLSAALHHATGQWMICADAIADPFTGMHAALAALASWQSGGGHLLDVSLVQTVQHALAFSRATVAT